MLCDNRISNQIFTGEEVNYILSWFKIAAVCFSHGDCVRYCNIIVGHRGGPACCFGDKYTGGSTCYCCPSWPEDLSRDSDERLNNSEACPAYIPIEDITDPTDSSLNRVVNFTPEFCSNCIQVFTSVYLKRRVISSCYIDEATIFSDED